MWGIKENNCFEEGKILEFVKVCFVWEHPITSQKQSNTMKSKRKKRKNIQLSQKGSFFDCKCSFQFTIANAAACKGVPFVDLFFAIS